MIASEKEITIYNEGKMSRDMTYIDDIVDGIISAIDLRNLAMIRNLKFLT